MNRLKHKKTRKISDKFFEKLTPKDKGIVFILFISYLASLISNGIVIESIKHVRDNREK